MTICRPFRHVKKNVICMCVLHDDDDDGAYFIKSVQQCKQKFKCGFTKHLLCYDRRADMLYYMLLGENDLYK